MARASAWRGPVRRLRARRVPHMGWNALRDATERRPRRARRRGRLLRPQLRCRPVRRAGGDRDRRPRRAARRGGRSRPRRRRPVPPRAQCPRGCPCHREPPAMVKKRVILPRRRRRKGRQGRQLREPPRDGRARGARAPLLELGADELRLPRHHGDPRGAWADPRGDRRAADELTIPFTAGGGVTGVEDARGLLLAGADKVAINRAAFDDPEIPTTLAAEFGSQAVVVAIDARAGEVVTHAGRSPRRGRLGARGGRARSGEVLLTDRRRRRRAPATTCRSRGRWPTRSAR